MGRFFRNQQKRDLNFWGITGVQDLIPKRVSAVNPMMAVTTQEAMENSAVWAAMRLRADLISTLPWRVFRDILMPDSSVPFRVDVSPSPMMTGVQFMEFLYSSQIELDRSGNAIGIIKEVDPRTNMPRKIALQPSSAVVVHVEDDEISDYSINGKKYPANVIWHEKQYTVPGLPVGLSPVQYAAFTLGQYKSIQQFASQWFVSGQGPRASLKNTEKKINGKEAAIVEEAWAASQNTGAPFIHGSDWDYSLLQAQSASNDWIEGQKMSLVDVSRFFNVPADLLDAAVSGGSHITYANVVQRNLQFLVMNLGPTIIRRETALSDMLPRPRMFEFDTDFLMRMDPISRAEWVNQQIEARVMTPTEGRAIFGRAPMTADQYEEFFRAGLVHGKAAILPGDPQDPNADPAIDTQIEDAK